MRRVEPSPKWRINKRETGLDVRTGSIRTDKNGLGPGSVRVPAAAGRGRPGFAPGSAPRQRLVGRVEQREHVVGAGGESRHADRDRDVGDVAVGRALLRDGAADFLGDVKRAPTGSAGQHGDDAVVVEPGDDIAGSDQGGHRFGRRSGPNGPPRRDRAIPEYRPAGRSPRTRAITAHGAAAPG